MILVPGIGGGKGVRIDVGVSLLLIVALEASLLGSGRLVVIGPLTLKMWLFLGSQMYVLYRLMAHESIKLSSVVIIISLFSILCLDMTIGVLQHATAELIGQDVSPLLYIVMLLFIEMVVRTKNQLQLIIRIIESAAMLMSIGCIAIAALVFTGILSFVRVYGWLSSSSQEFMFRGDIGFLFYKGFLYVGVGIIFLAFERSVVAKLSIIVAITALICSGTRGFIVALGAVILLHVMTGMMSLRKKVMYVCVSCVGVLLIVVLLSSISPGKAHSDTMRINTMYQVIGRITPLSLIFGNGLGVGVPGWSGHMEIAYAEIVHKQGLLGITWWVSVFILLVTRYRRARYINYTYAQPLFLSVIFVIAESATNPFINNPIGIFVWIIALVGLDVVSRNHLPPRFPVQSNCAVL